MAAHSAETLLAVKRFAAQATENVAMQTVGTWASGGSVERGVARFISDAQRALSRRIAPSERTTRYWCGPLTLIGPPLWRVGFPLERHEHGNGGGT